MVVRTDLAFLYLVFQCAYSLSFTGEIIQYCDPGFCDNNEYFNVLHMKCMKCDMKRHMLPSKDKMSCVCNSHSKVVHSDGLLFSKCEVCPSNSFPTPDQRECMPCEKISNKSDSNCKSCSKGQILVTRELDGRTKNIHCRNCTNGTVPSFDGTKCIPCSLNKVLINGHNCTCPPSFHEWHGNTCVSPEVIKEWPDERSTFLIRYNSGAEIDSGFFRNFLLPSISLCKKKNVTACQMVANMCAMVMYIDSYKGSPCSLFQDAKHIPTSDGNILPWLYYGEGEAPTVLNRKKIPTQYSLLKSSQISKLNLTVTRFSPFGYFKGLSTVNGSYLQLCPGSWASLDKGLRFGSRYQHSCSIPAKQLLERETEFLDLYLQYWDSGESFLYAVPILILNMNDGNSYNNKETDSTQWLLTRRFFLIDKVSGVKSIPGSLEKASFPSVVRYMKSCKLSVRLQDSEQGKIYPPLLIVSYGEITQEDIENNVFVHISFSTEYAMPDTLSHAIEVSVGVFSALAVIWSGIETWSYSRRSGRVAIDLFTLAELALFSCGNLANVFFLVVSCASLHTFFFFKGQSVIHLLLPSSKSEEFIRTYVITAFVLKIVEVIFMIWNQVTIDIFFIDWERPRALSSSIRTTSLATIGAGNGTEQPVSIWRTYFVANEWNEIQTKRKVSLFVQLILTVIFLKIVGIENWGVAEPDLSLDVPDYMTGIPPSLICRFAVIVMVYMVIYFIQWLYVVMFHERYISNGIHQFVDICCMANISVFILSLENFGYYIHGRSAHGFADTDMQTILTQLQREEEDMCGHRGLLPGTDHQTFQMSVPIQLRSYYKKVMAPISSII